MAIPRSEEIKDLAIKYSKQQLAQLAQRGEVDPTTAIMAGMMRDRIVQAEMIQQMPDTTVFQDTFTPKQDMASAAMGPPQDQLAQMRAPVEGQPQMAMMAQGGLASLDVPDDMVPDEYAGGGIIAFDVGGMVVDPIFGMGQEDFSGSMMPYKELVDLMTLPELQEYNRSGKIPPRLAGQVGGRAIDRPRAIQETKPVTPVAPAAKPTTPATTPAAPGAPVAGPGATQPAAKADDFASYLSRIEGAMPGGQALEGLEKEVQASREARKAEKTQAGWMSLAMAGLNVAAGTSPFALVNLGKGLSEGLKNYADELKDQKKLDREDKKLLADIEKARRDEKRGNVTAALGSYEKALDRLSAEDRQRIAAETSERVARIGAESRDQLGFLRDRLGKGETMVDIKELLKRNPYIEPTR
jgi:hypothetical protein